MTAPIRFGNFAESMRAQFQRNVTSSIRTLLQDKHLYQSVSVAPTNVYVQQNADKTTEQKEIESVTEAMNATWATKVYGPGGNLIHLVVPDVKVFCARCERIEPFNSAYTLEIFREIDSSKTYKDGGQVEQAFLLAYQCQSCKGTPELFLVRRRGLKLSNEGRSPIENVEVPQFIPKLLQKFLGGAVVAHQSGQTLAGLFLLRTLLEQWARAASGSKKEQADQVMEDYMAGLPTDLKERFPSMRTLYGELSIDIHSATGSVELFDKAREQIIEHFDARRMFKLPK